MPTWFPGCIVKTESNSLNVTVKLRDTLTNATWCATVKKKELLGELHFNQFLIGSEERCIDFQCQIARKLKYFSSTIEPGKVVNVLWEGKLFSATVLHQRDTPWDCMVGCAIDESVYRLGDFSAFVPVQWLEDRTFTIVPTACCFDIKCSLTGAISKVAKRAVTKNGMPPKTPKDAMIFSMHSSQKNIRECGTFIESKHCICYWERSGEWLSSVAKSLKDVSLETFAEHICYQDAGDYFAMYSDLDSAEFLVPSRYIRPSSSEINFQYLMAKQLKFFSNNIDIGTRVRVLWNCQLYSATVAHHCETPWEEIDKNCVLQFELYSAFVPVLWDEEETYSIVPVGCCFTALFCDKIYTTIDDHIAAAEGVSIEEKKDLPLLSPKEALLISMSSAGKVLNDTYKLFGNAPFMCFSREKGNWYPATPASLDDIRLETLCSHIKYNETGEYCAVQSVADASECLIPRKLCRRMNNG
mmetsp:Transcript_59006/g.71018  ORF Transcript_59006/g.71018 Transcript_59006/m.71018 type:complete len:470 (+) Transcript_59006:770-2179(+)